MKTNQYLLSHVPLLLLILAASTSINCTTQLPKPDPTANADSADGGWEGVLEEGVGSGATEASISNQI